MKYSIDFNNGSISGWIGDASDNAYVELYNSVQKVKKVTLDQIRPDVIKAGFSSKIKCGFNFNDCMRGFRSGDFAVVLIVDGEYKAYKSFLIGLDNEWSEHFENYQIPNRSDFSIQNGTALDLFKKNPDVIALKMLLIRLRRGVRGFGGRIKFVGNDYVEMENDWLFFDEFLRKNFISITSFLKTRSVWSLIDTYTDLGSHEERLAALSLSNILYHERFAQTFKNVYKFERREDPVLSGQLHYWGGMLSNQLSGDDSFDSFLTKNITLLSVYPLFLCFFAVLFSRFINEKDSVYGFNKDNSKYFQEVFNFYKNFLEEQLNKNSSSLWLDWSVDFEGL